MIISKNSSYLNFNSVNRIVGNLFFVVLLIYSIVYAVERVTYIDSAWQFFSRVNAEGFNFPSDRYGAFFSEIPLFIAVKMGLPFSVLVYTFSVSYILLYYIIWRLCTYSLNNPAAGIVVILSTFMGVREGFLHPVTETHQAIIFTALLYAVLNSEIKNTLKIIALCFVTILILFTHPIGAFTASFAIVYYMIDKREIKNPYALLCMVIVACICIWRFMATSDPYDASQYSMLKTSLSGNNSIWNSSPLNFLSLHFTHFYWLPELAGLIALIGLLLKKNWLKASILFMGVTIYSIIASITFYKGDSSIMLERVFLPAFFMINLALADLIVKQKQFNFWIPIALILFFIFNGIHYINGGCLIYKKRVNYLDQLVQAGISQGNDCYFLTEEMADKEKILVPWALGTETLIYSKFKYDKCISISMKQESCSSGALRLTNMFCLPAQQFNQNYFHYSGKAPITLIIK